MDVVSIITINYNGYEETREFLESIRCHLKEENYQYEVIVVDNASSGNDAELIEAKFPWVRLIKSDENLGFSGGNNLGIKYAKGNYFFFLNNDVVIDSDIISNLLPLFADTSVGVISPKVVDYEAKRILHNGAQFPGKFMIRIHFFNDLKREEEVFPIPFAIGSAVLVKKQVVTMAGGWPDMYFLYEEELDWSLTIRKKGFIILYAPSAVFHKGGMSTGKNSPLRAYYSTRNRLLLYKRHLSGIYRMGAILFTLCIAIPQQCIKHIQNKEQALCKAKIIGIIDFLRGRFYQRKKAFDKL